VPVSRQLQHYLHSTIGIPRQQISRIVNGVDSRRFRPRQGHDALPAGFPAGWQSALVIGWVGRMQPVKDPLNLVNAFCLACQASPSFADNARLVLIGDGPLHAEAVSLLRQQHRLAQAWLPGERDDIAALMRCFDVFVLPSQAEGISNTVLEAMASGLPVIATAVGGTVELVVNQHTGLLVAPQDPGALAQGLVTLSANASLRQSMGAAGRARVEQCFALPVMLRRYQQLYDHCLSAAEAV
jgi:glycosyltransferase involved in cell wall biosynthesis